MIAHKFSLGHRSSLEKKSNGSLFLSQKSKLGIIHCLARETRKLHTEIKHTAVLSRSTSHPPPPSSSPHPPLSLSLSLSLSFSIHSVTHSLTHTCAHAHTHAYRDRERGRGRNESGAKNERTRIDRQNDLPTYLLTRKLTNIQTDR